jgi:photosystem II stability/assembly factor-like uncharacterized protein
MKRYLPFFLILAFSGSLQLFGQITIEPTPSTQGLWGSALNGRGESFVVGNNGTILRKRGACNSWEQLNVPVTNGLRSITFIKDSIGIAVGVSGTVFRSTNWGDSWALTSSSTTAGLLAVTQLNDSILLATGGGSVGNLVIRSLDLGLTWTVATSALSSSGFGLAVVNDSTVMLSGVQGMVMRSTDHGASWSSVMGAFAGTLTDITFGDSNVGIIVGQGGAVYRTEDGGLTWVLTPSSTGIFLNGVYAVSASRFIAVGNTGTVIETSDSGKTWSLFATGNTTTLRIVNQNSNGFFAGGNSGVIFSFTPSLGYQVLFREDFCAFQDSTSVPLGWTNISLGTSGAAWRFDNPRSATNGLNTILEPPFAIYDAGLYNQSAADTAALITETFSTIGHPQISLRWHESFVPSQQGQTRVYIQYWTGTGWQTAYSYDGARDGAGRATTQTGVGGVISQKRSVDLPGAGNLSNTQVRFVFSATGANRQWWAIDNLEVISATRDMEAETLVYNDSACSLPVQDSPMVLIKNNSLFGIYPIELAWRADGGPISYTTHQVDVGAGQAVTLPVSNAPILVGGSGLLEVWMVNTFEPNASNDSTSAIYGTGSLAIGFNGDTLQLCQGDTVALAAAIQGASFQWSGAATGASDTVFAIAGGWYVLTATLNGCTATDSIFVHEILLPMNPLPGALPDTVLQLAVETIPAPGGGLSGRYRILFNNSGANLLLLDTVSNSSFTFQFDSVGVYEVILDIVNQGCMVSYAQEVVVELPNVGLADLGNSAMRWYPNPVREVLYFETTIPDCTVRILTITGQLLLEKQLGSGKGQIQTVNWPSGSYLIQVSHPHDGFFRSDRLLILPR